MSRFCENGIENKKERLRPCNLPFIGINFVKRGQLHLLRWSEEVVRLHMEEEQDWRFHSISLACKCQHFSVIMLITKGD